MAEVQERLEARFPDLDPTVVEPRSGSGGRDHRPGPRLRAAARRARRPRRPRRSVADEDAATSHWAPDTAPSRSADAGEMTANDR